MASQPQKLLTFEDRFNHDDFHNHLENGGGGVYLLRWLHDSWGEAARGVIGQVLAEG